MKLISLIFVLLLCALSSCVHLKHFRSKDYPLAPGDLQSAEDAPALVDTPNATVEIRSHSFNHYIHVGIIIRAKEKDLNYGRLKVFIETSNKQKRYVSEAESMQYLCAEKAWNDHFKNSSVTTFIVTKNCPLKVSYTFDANFKLNDLFEKDDIMSGFKFIDHGLDSNNPLTVMLMPFRS